MTTKDEALSIALDFAERVHDGEWLHGTSRDDVVEAIKSALAQSPEGEAEEFIQAAIDNAPEPLQRLGRFLSTLLDEDQWKTAEGMLLGAALAQPKPADLPCELPDEWPRDFIDWYQNLPEKSPESLWVIWSAYYLQLTDILTQPKQEPEKLWLWRNFVNSNPEYWAFDNPFPIFLDSHDPQTLGEPCGYALLKQSRKGRPDVSDEEVLRCVKQSLKQEQPKPVAWRDHVEQRLLTWRQSFINNSGDQLALDDFMDKHSLDDLIDFVCSEYSNPNAGSAPTKQESYGYVTTLRNGTQHFYKTSPYLDNAIDCIAVFAGSAPT